MSQSITTKFMLLADPQLGMASFLLNKHSGRTTPNHHGEIVAPEGAPEAGWPYEEARFRRAVEIANGTEPDFVVVLGDMVMNWDIAGQAASAMEAGSAISPSIPLYWVPGNHDVGVDFTAATDESLALYRSNFGPDRYSFTAGPCRFIAFNSALFDRPESVPSEYEVQLEWLKQELAKPLESDVHHTVAFAHHPPFVQDPDEDDSSFNLPASQRQLLLDLLTGHGVRYYFSGHTHSNLITSYKDLRIVATSAIGISRSGHASGYRMVESDSDSISHSFYALP